jgi:hypothetical protein
LRFAFSENNGWSPYFSAKASTDSVAGASDAASEGVRPGSSVTVEVGEFATAVLVLGGFDTGPAQLANKLANILINSTAPGILIYFFIKKVLILKINSPST